MARYSPNPKPSTSTNNWLKCPVWTERKDEQKVKNINATLYLADDDETIRKKVAKAKRIWHSTEPLSAKTRLYREYFLLMRLVWNPM